MSYRVWECKIVVPVDAVLPSGFNAPPRNAAENAVRSCGIEILACFSGWAGTLDTIEAQLVEDDDPNYLFGRHNKC